MEQERKGLDMTTGRRFNSLVTTPAPEGIQTTDLVPFVSGTGFERFSNPIPGALNIWECISVSDRVAYPCGECKHCQARAVAAALLKGVAS